MYKKFFASLLLLLAILVGSVPVQASTIPAGFKEWPLQTSTDSRKIWTIKFNAPLDYSSINNLNVYVTDDNHNVVKTSLKQSVDRTAIQISPVNAYTLGKKYWIYITQGITSDNGKNYLVQPIVVPFTISNGPSGTPAPDEKIMLISHTYSSVLTNFTVTTSPDVFAVKINQISALYEGNNTFVLGLPNIAPGAKVTVTAYDSNGKLLQSKIYAVLSP